MTWPSEWKRHAAEMDRRPSRPFDAVRLFEDRPIVHHPPYQEPFARQVGVKSALAAILEQKILAAVSPHEHLVALLG